jgi:hypothetical protein
MGVGHDEDFERPPLCVVGQIRRDRLLGAARRETKASAKRQFDGR